MVNLKMLIGIQISFIYNGCSIEKNIWYYFPTISKKLADIQTKKNFLLLDIIEQQVIEQVHNDDEKVNDGNYLILLLMVIEQVLDAVLGISGNPYAIFNPLSNNFEQWLCCSLYQIFGWSIKTAPNIKI